MGRYLNPGNAGFGQILKSTYVDKTGLIDYVNSTIESGYKLTCFSRPRRFGKSYAAKMLCAYYDKSCDSHTLFNALEISGKPSYEIYLNKYNVIYLDITWFISTVGDIRDVVKDLQSKVIREIKAAFPSCETEDGASLPEVLFSAAESAREKFIIIIDEWDAVFREAKEDYDLQKEYLMLLRGLFKSGPITDRMIAAAYMTGILPIKKYGTQSALTDFREFTMTQPGKLARYVGFTEEEVSALCEEYAVDFPSMRMWYDGYSFNSIRHIYSPNSVMSALLYDEFANYWTKTETYESVKPYISMNLDGLRDAVIAMLGGLSVKVDPLGFQNDMTSIRNRDDSLTLLVHLGYLAYDAKKREVHIPNLEVSDSFKLAVQDASWLEVGEAIRQSDDLLQATIDMDADAVASALERIHESASSVLQYNNENSLSCALTIAYYTARRFYTIVRELPSGKGFADLAFIPHKDCDKPAMIVELKYNQSADCAIRQIKENRYDGVLKEYGDDLLLVGINYNRDGEDKKRHICVIEQR